MSGMVWGRLEFHGNIEQSLTQTRASRKTFKKKRLFDQYLKDKFCLVQWGKGPSGWKECHMWRPRWERNWRGGGPGWKWREGRESRHILPLALPSPPSSLLISFLWVLSAALRSIPLTPRPSPVPCSLSGSSFFLCLQLLPKSLAPFLFKLNTDFSLPE